MVQETRDEKTCTKPQFCWLLVFYLVLNEIPQLSITMAVAARDVFADRTFDEAQATVRKLMDREPAAWEEVLGFPCDPGIKRILTSLSRWEEPDLSGFDPTPFGEFWGLSSFRRSLASEAE